MQQIGIKMNKLLQKVAFPRERESFKFFTNSEKIEPQLHQIGVTDNYHYFYTENIKIFFWFYMNVIICP